MPKLKPGTLVPTQNEDSAITAAAMDDPDARPFSDEEWALVKPDLGGHAPGEPVSNERESTR